MSKPQEDLPQQQPSQAATSQAETVRTNPIEKSTTYDRILRPLRLAAIWGAANGGFIWLAFKRDVFLRTFWGQSTILGYADEKHAITYGAFIVLVTGWILLAVVFLFIRRKQSARMAEMILLFIGVAVTLWLSIGSTVHGA